MASPDRLGNVDSFLSEIEWTTSNINKLALLRQFVANIPSDGIRYQYSSAEQVANPDFQVMMDDYWSELLRRTHYAATVSLLRANAWLNGVFSGVRDGNFHAFSACLRGLIESVADSALALQWIPAHLESKRLSISTALNRRAVLEKYEDYFDELLENELIHFSHARGTKKGEVVPDTALHKAKTAKAYLDTLKAGPGEALISMYETLCQVTHPSSDSSLAFVLVHHDREDHSEYEIRNDLSFANLIGFARRYKTNFALTLNLAVDPAINCLQLVSSFSRFRSPGGLKL